MSIRTPIGPWVSGLDTIVDPLIGALAKSPDCQDVRFHSGLLRQRPGLRVLDLEPSDIDSGSGNAKTRISLDFDGINDIVRDTSFAVTMGTKWTIRWECAFNFTDNEVSGTHTLLATAAATYAPVIINAVGDGTKIQIQVTIKDSAGVTVTLTSTNRTAAEWNTFAAYSSARNIRVTRNEGTVSLYVGEQLEDTDTGMGTAQHEITTAISAGANTAVANFAKMQWFGTLVIVNRVMGEDECYWGLNWPIDEIPEKDVLLCWAAIENTGTTIKDYSSYANDGTITGATWTGASHAMGRFLGIYTHRKRNGVKYHILAASRTADNASSAAPSGVLYFSVVRDAFFPFFFGGVKAANDATSAIDGFDLLAKWQFLSVGDLCYMANGKDYTRKLDPDTAPGFARYWGITAPALAPDVAAVGSGGAMSAGQYGVAYSYVNTLTGEESGLSPITTTTAVLNDSFVMDAFPSSDPQVNRIRFYRTISASTTTGNTTVMYQLPSGEVVNGNPPRLTDGTSDAALIFGRVVPGADLSGNLLLKRAYLQGGPGVAPTMTGVTAGGSVDAGGHYYAYSHYNPTTGAETGMSPWVTAITAGGNLTVPLSAMILPVQNSGYTQMRIYGTPVIGTSRIIYLVATVTAAATYSVTLSDATLITQGTIETRALPPKCRYAVVFANRVWMAGDDANPSMVYWSTSGDYGAFPWTSGHGPNAGSEVTGLATVGNLLLVSYSDGSVFALPHPGNQTDLEFFVPLNMTGWAPTGAAISHYSIQDTPFGVIWLSRNGFRLVTVDGITDIAPSIGPSFLNLNRIRARYACSLYSRDDNTYRCWISRGTQRLNEQAFYCDMKGILGGEGVKWGIDNLHADAAGILLDSLEIPHYCTGVETGALVELLADSATDADYDGDGSGTLSGSVTLPGINRFAAIAGRTAPVGGDSGYPLWLVKSDGTAYQRYALRPSLAISGPNFYPSLVALTSGTWLVHYHGIRGTWTTMKTFLGDPRREKTFLTLYVTHAKGSAGTMLVEFRCNDSATWVSAGTFALTNNQASQIPLAVNGASGRSIQFRVTHDPPKAGEVFKIVTAEVEWDAAGDTP